MEIHTHNIEWRKRRVSFNPVGIDFSEGEYTLAAYVSLVVECFIGIIQNYGKEVGIRSLSFVAPEYAGPVVGVALYDYVEKRIMIIRLLS